MERQSNNVPGSHAYIAVMARETYLPSAKYDIGGRQSDQFLWSPIYTHCLKRRDRWNTGRQNVVGVVLHMHGLSFWVLKHHAFHLILFVAYTHRRYDTCRVKLTTITATFVGFISHYCAEHPAHNKLAGWILERGKTTNVLAKKPTVNATGTYCTRDTTWDGWKPFFWSTELKKVENLERD